MARAALNWTVRDLADRAGVSHDTIVRIERGDQTLKDSTIGKVRAAFEVERIEFTNGNSPGVRIHLPDGSAFEAPAALPRDPL